MRIVKRAKDIRYAYVEDNKGKIEKRYIYKCCICGKEIFEYRPVRLSKQLFGYGTYKQYCTVRNYDFCSECWDVLDDLLFKWQRNKQKGI